MEFPSNMDNTFDTRTIGGTLEHNTSYEWWVQAYCSENQSYYSDWSTIDTFYISNFVPQDFTPEIEVELSSLVCEEYTDINFNLETGFKRARYSINTSNFQFRKYRLS